MSASISSAAQAFLVVVFMMLKGAVYLSLLAMVGQFLVADMQGTNAGGQSYYLVSALLYMRQTLEQQFTNDATSCRSAIAKLLLEAAVFTEGTQAFIATGILLQSGAVGFSLHKPAWTDLDDCGKPMVNMWQFPFSVTAISSHPSSWTMTEGWQIFEMIKAIVSRTPWCLILYRPKDSQSWGKVEEHFEVWSTRQLHIAALLMASKDINEADADQRQELTRALLRTNVRSYG